MNFSRQFIVFAFLWGVFQMPAGASGFDTPPLWIRTFAELRLPPQLTKTEIRYFLNSAMPLHNLAFVDLGGMSDFMHVHVVFRPLDPATPPPDFQLSSMTASWDWSTVKLEAFLFHTQEYDFLRPDRSYRGAYGRLDPLARNWILWPKASGRSQPEPAHLYMEDPPQERPHTVTTAQLDPEIFGASPGKWEYSFYFFRVNCGDVEFMSLEEQERSSILSVSLQGEPVCLNLVAFSCRHNPSARECKGSRLLEPYYSY